MSEGSQSKTLLPRFSSPPLLPQILLRYRIPRPLRIPINLHAPPALPIIKKFHAVDPAIDRFPILRLARFIGRIDVRHRSKRIRLPAQLVLEKSVLQEITSRAVRVIFRSHHRQTRLAVFWHSNRTQPPILATP